MRPLCTVDGESWEALAFLVQSMFQAHALLVVALALLACFVWSFIGMVAGYLADVIAERVEARWPGRFPPITRHVDHYSCVRCG